MKLLDIYEKTEEFCRAEGGEDSVAAASLFTVGIALKDYFWPDLSFDETEEYSFEEIWYMICQCHEEKIERKDTDISDAGVLPLYQYIEGGIQYTNGISVRSSMYTELEVVDYFWFRNVCSADGKPDHGIVGGMLLYEYLIQRRMKRGGEFDNSVLNLYSYAANTMMVHNMHKQKEDGRKISFWEDPLLFLFLFAETIEPLQYIRNETDFRKVLRRIKVRAFQRKLIISVDPHYYDMFELEKKMELLNKKMHICCEIVRETSELYICV